MEELDPVEAKHLLERLGQNSPDCIFLASADWTEAQYVSAAYEDIWGQSREAVYEDPTDFLAGIHPEDRDRVRESMAELSDGTSSELQYRVNPGEDYGRWVWAYGEPIREDGEVVNVGGFVRDITEQRRRRQEQERKREKLEMLNQVVRHDLRNEMQIVRGRTELLEDHVDDGGEEHLDDIRLSVQEAIGLTTTARDLTKTMLEDGPEHRPVSVPNVVRSAVETVRTRHDGVAITIYGIGQEARVNADDMLESVFHNLLQNAVIHNDADMPEIEVRVEVDEDVVVRVADNGPSVPDARKDVIFGRGEKGLESPGTGLGLYLARTLVEGYDGEIWVADDQPEGSVFTVALPLAAD
ncbi:PAS domain-containing sensor histidine kinase [Halostella litorea]|uniref:PAS domain-containing sensor histidine kinase n=1 Tax=Halostella litorea TaxID=2528831 RepID=UPI0013871294|nr:PAS domain-containing sensor histidine kinase [Halostella litorea]